MGMHTPVMTILLKYVNNKHRHDNNYYIAKALIDCFDEIPNMTVYEVADRCYVSPAAISRFIRHIGYSSFTEFKEACAKRIDITNDYSKKANQLASDEFSAFANDFTQHIISNLSSFNQTADYEQLARINQLIHDSEDVAVFGLEFASFLAQHLQIKLAGMHKLIHIGTTIDEQMKIVEKMSLQSVVIVFSLEGGYFYYNDKLIALLEEKGIKLVVFTINRTSKIERIADEIVCCGNINEDTEGRISILYIMELLIYQYKQKFYE